MSAQPGATIPTAAQIAAIHSARKVAAVRQAKRAPFFRGKLDHIDLDRLDDPVEWAKIPLLDKDMLRSMSDAQFYRDFCLPPGEGDGIAQYWRSGGTTGRPLFYPRSRRDIEVAMHGFARVYPCAGAKPGQTVHCAFPLGIHPVGQMMARAAEASGLGALMAGAGTTTPSSLQIELIDKLKPDVLTGMSSYALHLANLADQNGIELARGSVNLVICSAEPLSVAKREKLGRMWGAEVRDSFGMTEAGMMAAEDGIADGFRVWSDLFFVEVVDPDERPGAAGAERPAHSWSRRSSPTTSRRSCAGCPAISSRCGVTCPAPARSRSFRCCAMPSAPPGSSRSAASTSITASSRT